MSFRPYMHVERLGHPEVDGIEIGTVHVFPKLDGTNASVWVEYGDDSPELHAGSRRRHLTLEADNHGFCRWVHEQSADPSSPLQKLDQRHSGRDWILYGEWLVPHTIKKYRDDAWRQFYVFDVYDRLYDQYIPFEEYEPELTSAGLNVVYPLAIVTNPDDAALQRLVNQNTYLMLDGQGAGEGVVLKNYDFTNAHGRQTWAKIVRNEFKEDARKAMGVSEIDGKERIETKIAQTLCTSHLIDKTRLMVEKMAFAQNVDGYAEQDPEAYEQWLAKNRGTIIPRLLQTVFYELVREEIWHMLKLEKRLPTIDFKRLQQETTLAVKRHCSDLF